MRDIRQKGGGSSGDWIFGGEMQGIGMMGNEQVDQVGYSVVVLETSDQLAGFGGVAFASQVVVVDV
jgi:hypothetical protein